MDDADQELDALLGGDALAVPPSAATRARHLALLASATATPVPRFDRFGGFMRRHRPLVAAGSLAGLLLVATPATAALAGGAQPGQALYGTKLFFERVELALERSPTRRVALQLQFSEDRLAEISALLRSGHTGGLTSAEQRLLAQEASVEAELARLQSQGRADPSLVDRVSATARAHGEQLGALASAEGCHADSSDSPDCSGLLVARDASEQFADQVAGSGGPGRSGSGDNGTTAAGGGGGGDGKSGGPVPAQGSTVPSVPPMRTPGTSGGDHSGSGSGSGDHSPAGSPTPSPSPSHSDSGSGSGSGGDGASGSAH